MGSQLPSVANMDKIIAVLLFIQACSALPNYPTTQASGYGEPQQKCRQVEEVVYTEKCEDYTDKLCFTTFEEQCNDVRDQTCRATVSSSQSRKCFNVIETRCILKEDVSNEVVEAITFVQRCSKDVERVCDTIAEVDFSTSTREQCINVPSLICNTEERTVFEKTCKTETSFDCSGISASSNQNSGSSDYRSSQDGYSQDQDQFSNNAPYGQQPAQEVTCRRQQDQRCHTTPRQISSQTCQRREERVCERMTENFPQVGDRQVCRNEEKRNCRLEKRTQPKQVKKFTYTKVCRPMTKRICENVDQRTLVPSCVPTTRKECQSRPNERCEDIPKRNCFKVPSTVVREQCESVDNFSSGSSQNFQDGNTASYQ